MCPHGEPIVEQCVQCCPDPAFRLWMAWAWDVYDEDKDAGMEMLVGYVAKVLVEAGR